jgi:hypothetical protein
MPKLSRLSEDEVKAMRSRKSGQSERARVRQQYVEYLKDYKPGDWVSVELDSGENRQTVKNRLKAAAKELGVNLNFARSRGALRFEVQ